MLKLTGMILKGGVALVMLLVAAWGGWRWGDRVFPPFERVLGVEDDASTQADSLPTVTLAEEALHRWERFSREDGQDELLVSDLEVTSVLRHGFPGLVPPGIADPTVEFEAGGMEITGRVARRMFPGLPDLGGVVGILPDTVPMKVRAVLIPFGGDETALVVRGVSVSGVPLPRRLVPSILEALGRRDRPGLPPEAVPVPLPDQVARAYILGDSLHVVRGR